MEEELIKNQERLKPQEEKQEEERSRVDDLRGSPMSVGTLEEIIDDNHAIVSTSVGSEHYVSILSFVDKDQLEPGRSLRQAGCITFILMPFSTKIVTYNSLLTFPSMASAFRCFHYPFHICHFYLFLVDHLGVFCSLTIHFMLLLIHFS